MRVTVKLFAAFSGSPGAETRALELPQGSRMFQLLNAMQIRTGTTRLAIVGSLLMVNQSRADLETILKEGDVVSIFDVPGG